MFAFTMTQHIQSFGEILYVQLRAAKKRAERLEIAGKMLLGQQDGVFWLFHYLTDDDAASQKAILRLFRTLRPGVERQVREFAAGADEYYRVAVSPWPCERSSGASSTRSRSIRPDEVFAVALSGRVRKAEVTVVRPTSGVSTSAGKTAAPREARSLERFEAADVPDEGTRRPVGLP